MTTGEEHASTRGGADATRTLFSKHKWLTDLSLPDIPRAMLYLKPLLKVALP
jgi:hypothetical protein